MKENSIKLVLKIGSMALIRKEDNDIDYNIFARLGSDLKPGMLLVTSGATEIGRLDYMKRNSFELEGDIEQVKTDYSAQGQAILIENYRRFVQPQYSIRQVLVEHQHFNDEEKREHIKNLFLRAPAQNAIPIVNYNDTVSSEENRKMELVYLKNHNNDQEVHECIDNDETASVITELINAPTLLMLTRTDGIYRQSNDPSTLIREIKASSKSELCRKVYELRSSCIGTSRAGSNGAYAKLNFALEAALHGTKAIIGNAKFHVNELVEGNVPCTIIQLTK